MGHIWEQHWAIHTCAHTCPLLPSYIAPCRPHMWPIAAPMYTPILCGYMAYCCPHCCSHIWPITALIYGLLLTPYMRAYMAHGYSHIYPISAPIMYGPLLLLYIASAKRLIQIKHKAWRFGDTLPSYRRHPKNTNKTTTPLNQRH
jgi:hypothetical protein